MKKMTFSLTALVDTIRANDANRTLTFAFCLFVVALAARFCFSTSVVAEGFLFVAEAALVGGVADWFAVTALFEKPFGFPYHTAILPRRRKAFIDASITMVQKEFFSKRNVIAHLEKLHLLPMLMGWLGETTTKERCLREFQGYAQKFISHDFREETAKTLAIEIKRHLTEIPVGMPAKKLSDWLKKSGEDRRLVNKFGEIFGEFVAEERTYTLILHGLEEYAKAQAKSPFEQFMAGLAQMLDFVNIDEAAELIWHRLKKIAADIAGDSPLTDALLKEMHDALGRVGDGDGEFSAATENMKKELIANLPLEDMLSSLLGELGKMPPELMTVMSAEYDATLTMINADEKLRRRVERFLYDVAARSALHAQGLIGKVVQKVLEKLTDAELNRLVREKIEPDLLWIRINGSLVGSAVGLFIFVVMTAVK